MILSTNQPDNQAKLAGIETGGKLRGLKFGPIILYILFIFSACVPAPPATPTPTPTRPLVAINSKNVEALVGVQAALREFKFGLAPLLLEEETRLVVEAGPDGEVARLAYPRQPANPLDWPTMDSFVFACAVRSLLLDSPQVRRIALGRFDLAAPVDDPQERISHFAAWVKFTDRSEAVVDFTPLATNFAAQHFANEFIVQAGEIESRFAAWREGVLLDVLQPLKVVEQDGGVYYLVAKALVFPDRYEFFLQAHITQTATPIRPLQLTRGAMAKIEVERADFEAIRQLMIEAGPTVFNEKPELFSRVGDNDPALAAVLDDHLHLLWHMVTKLEHQPQPKPVGSPSPTFTPSPSPSPTSTPTPTPTPTKASLPLKTS